MSVSNGQIADENTFNDSFLSRTATNTDTIAKVDLKNADAASGANVINAQREINSNNAFSGRPSGSAHDATPAWVNTQVGSGSDNLKARSEALTEKFDPVTGHNHDGSAGSGGPIDADDLANVPLRGYVKQGVDIVGAAGLDEDISAQFSTKEPSSGPTVEGVPVTAPYNKAFIRLTTSNDPIEDGSGNQVYGRITNSGGLGGTWTLTFYVDDGGVETPYNMSSSNISFWYQELFRITNPSATVYSEEFFVPSDNATSDVVDATPIQAGKVSTGVQEFGGEKDFTDGFATESSDVATAATIAALANTTSYVRLTGATTTTVQGILAPVSGNSKRLIVSNVSSATITFAHQNGSAAASDRIITPDGTDISVSPNASIEFIYDISQSRWVVVSSGVGGSSGGGAYHEAVRAASTTNLNLASMPASVGGVTLASGDRFGAFGQTLPEENGFYVFNGAASAATRALDLNASSEVVRGMAVYVLEGDLESSLWILQSAGPYTLGTTGLTFVQWREWNKENLTLNGTDITNQYKDLAFEAVPESIDLKVTGAGAVEGVDYTLSVVSNVTRITFAGDLATGGAAALISGDILNIQYQVRP